MKKRRLVFALFSLFLLVSVILQPTFAAERGVLPSGVGLDEIGAEIEAFAEEHEDTTVGFSTAVFNREGVIYSGYFGFANEEDGIAVNAQTVMEWGSVSKLTVWVSVMQLWEQGKIDLNEDIQVYLPHGFLKKLAYEKPITMLDLMNHTAGFEDIAFGLNAEDEESILSLEEALLKYQPEQRFEPGVVQAYSNYGAALAGFIVERVSGQPYYAYVKEHIFEPLGMERSALLPDLSDNPWVRTQREQLHCYRGDCSLIANGRDYVILYPCGMCTSTLEDFVKFGQALLDTNGPLFESSATYEAIFAPSAFLGDTNVPSCRHGFWPFYEGSDVVYHSGNTKGCSSALYLDLKSGTGMVIMTNQQNESVYNFLLPEVLLFGNAYQYSGEFQNQYSSGYVESSRNIWTGPLKLYRLVNVISLSDISGFITETDSNGVQRYACSGGDLLPVSTLTVILMNGSVILWGLASLFSLVRLLVRLVQRLCRKQKSPLGAWGIWSCVVQLPFPLLILPVAQTLMTLEWWPMWCYRLCFIGAFILCLAMAVLFVIGIVRRNRLALTKKQKVLRIILMLNLLIAIWNIVYWNMFMFWMIP